ncbi:hypothetical protein Aco03nite_076140 [Actinoplanes couchii]|uniref:DUF5753 domain-containing protein n=1 Tax=Actinoplanes couchii TaxID=403638 RepID=A0ABQ3XL56_9ACTN|nr:hypothetical protein Aco03nite_076140 [Actinoplanes couchii]
MRSPGSSPLLSSSDPYRHGRDPETFRGSRRSEILDRRPEVEIYEAIWRDLVDRIAPIETESRRIIENKVEEWSRACPERCPLAQERPLRR